MDSRSQAKCPLCGESVKIDDLDAVQLHAGVGGILHKSCLNDYEDEEES